MENSNDIKSLLEEIAVSVLKDKIGNYDILTEEDKKDILFCVTDPVQIMEYLEFENKLNKQRAWKKIMFDRKKIIFEKVFDRLNNPLCLFAYKYVNDFKTSEDIVQNVFIKVWEDDTISFHDMKKVDGLFYTIVKNKSLDFLRSKYAKDVQAYPIENLEIFQTEKYNLKETFIVDTSTIIHNAINSLPNKCGYVMKLSLKGYSNKEIASEMQLSVQTVKVHKKNAYKKLRKIFGQKTKFWLNSES